MGASHPLNDTYPKLGSAPLDVDPNYLAIGMMFARSFLEKEPRLIWDDYSTDENKRILQRELAVACRIAEERGLFKDGTLQRIFSEVLEVWPAPDLEHYPEEPCSGL